jgi:hypothetical protein
LRAGAQLLKTPIQGHNPTLAAIRPLAEGTHRPLRVIVRASTQTGMKRRQF